jgi:hypothetical protein
MAEVKQLSQRSVIGGVNLKFIISALPWFGRQLSRRKAVKRIYCTRITKFKSFRCRDIFSWCTYIKIFEKMSIFSNKRLIDHQVYTIVLLVWLGELNAEELHHFVRMGRTDACATWKSVTTSRSFQCTSSIAMCTVQVLQVARPDPPGGWYRSSEWLYQVHQGLVQVL